MIIEGSNGFSSSAEAAIIDPLGRVLKRVDPGAPVNVSDLPGGVYTLRVSDKGNITSCRFIRLIR